MQTRPGGVKGSVVVAMAALALAAPISYDLVRSPRYRPFGYLAADAFYYLSVARTSLEVGFPSFDGVRPTNGFHPLWQVFVAAIYGLLRFVRHGHQSPLVVVLTSLVCVTAALWLLGRAWIRSDGRVPVPFVALPFGIYPLLVVYQYLRLPQGPAIDGGNEGPVILYGTLYSFVNGMESGLTLLAFAWAACIFVRFSGFTPKAGFAQGAALAILGLARLDHLAFAVTPACIWILLLVAAPRGGRPYALAALTALGLPFITYIALNRGYADSYLPLSGTAKSTFPIPLDDSIRYFRNFVEHPSARIPAHDLYRYFAPLTSILFASLYGLLALRILPSERSWLVTFAPWAKPLDRFLLLMTPGVLVLAIYNSFFVFPSGIGHWYFSVSLLYVSIVTLRLYGALTRGLPTPPHTFAWTAILAWLALTWIGFARCHYQPEYHQLYARFYWETAPRIRANFPGRLPLFEFDDGIVSFGLRWPAMSATGLTLDAEAATLDDTRRRVDIALERKFNVVGSVFYNNHTLRMNSSESDALTWTSDVLGEHVRNRHAKILWADEVATLVQLE